MLKTGARQLLEMLANPVGMEVPKGWKTIQQLCKETGRSESMIRKTVHSGIADGSIERRVFYVPCAERGHLPVAHYFIKQKRGQV